MRISAYLIPLMLFIVAGEVRATSPLAVTSPDGRVQIEFSLRKTENADAAPHYRVMFREKEIVGYSRLGIDMQGEDSLGGNCQVESTESQSVYEEYTQITGKRRTVTSHATTLVIRLRETAGPHRNWEVVFRAYDDGVAFRYRFPKQEGWNELAILEERTEFCLPAHSTVFALPLNGFTTSYEKRYEVKKVEGLPKDWLLGMPFLFEVSDGTWAAITEANVNEYAGTYLEPRSSGCLSTRLSPHPIEPAVAVRSPLPHASPWRVVMLGDQIGRLVESDIVLNLSDACAIEDTSWIKTGKTTFPWWNGFYEERVKFKPGLNTATAKHYIDFCAEAGIPYHSLDGIENTAWYSGPIVPYEGADITAALPEIDLPEVLKYAKAKGVRLRLWMHWKAAATHMEKAFPLYREWGIEGVMLDFMDRDDQEMNQFVRKAVKLAADNQLTVTLHGCPKPTGLERTYPNLLTHEAVMNLEYDKWDPQGITPDHEITVPFTRMLAGPLDFHQGSFRAVKPEAFKPRNDAPLVMGTAARTLASYVVYQNHLSMVADYPTAYRGHPGLPILSAIPTTWDDTKVLDAQVGEYIVVARRSGTVWYVGAMTDRKERTLEVPLQFLSPGRFHAEIVADDVAAKHGMSITGQTVSSSERLRVALTQAGGCFVKITME